MPAQKLVGKIEKKEKLVSNANAKPRLVGKITSIPTKVMKSGDTVKTVYPKNISGIGKMKVVSQLTKIMVPQTKKKLK